MSVRTFDHCLSNPPYQENSFEREKAITECRDIYHFFHQLGTLIAVKTSMIYPGGRWMQRSNRKAANIIYGNVMKIEWYENAKNHSTEKIFPHAIINDGVSIILADRIGTETVSYNGGMIQKTDDLILPVGKTINNVLLRKSFNNNVSYRRQSTNVNGIRTYAVERNPENYVRLMEYESRLLEKFMALENTFSKQKFVEYVGVHGSLLGDHHADENMVLGYLGNSSVGSAKRSEFYWFDKKYMRNTVQSVGVFSCWKVCVSQGRMNKQPETGNYFVLPENVAVGETTTVVGVFGSKLEAVNYAGYLNSGVGRIGLAMGAGGGSRTWGLFLPDLGDYSIEYDYERMLEDLENYDNFEDYEEQ